MKAVVETPYYDWDGRKYMEFQFENKITRVKIPFRYGRVMCRVEGLKTIQELQKGDEVEIELEKKVWDGVEHWVIFSLRT
jgi:hypothetical protein